MITKTKQTFKVKNFWTAQIYNISEEKNTFMAHANTDESHNFWQNTFVIPSEDPLLVIPC